MDANKATRDKDGYWWIQGRIDDVLKVAGHKIYIMLGERSIAGRCQAQLYSEPQAASG
jgi:acetyl-CoA synthetase